MTMRVLFVQKEGGIFGAENYQLKVIPGLLSKGIDVHFLRLYTDYQGGKDGEFVRRIKEFGVKVFQVNIGRYPNLRGVKSIHRVVGISNYDLVHTHLIHADFYLALVKLIFRGRYLLVSTKHGYDNAFTSKYGFDAAKQRITPYFAISKWAESRMDASFTISNGLRDFFISTGLSKPDKMSLIHYGFDMPDFTIDKGKRNYRHAIKQVIIAGRLIPFKGHRFLIEAMAEVKKAFGNDVKLIVAGTGELDQELLNQVEDLGLKGAVDFIGYSNEVGAYMANSDVVVIPSISEGFGVVFLEAFASKTPVIAWNVPSGNELIVHEQTGYLVDPYNVKELGKQIIDILENHDQQDQITQNAYNRLKSHFNLNRMIEETLSFYHKTLRR